MAMNVVEPLIGGALIGGASLLALVVSGKVPGISGVVARVMRPKAGDVWWRVLFIMGILAGAYGTMMIQPEWARFTLPAGRGAITLAVAGLLVGFGTRLGGGCTSGHGVCGIGAGAKDALVYTCLFMAAGMVTVFLWNL